MNSVHTLPHGDRELGGSRFVLTKYTDAPGAAPVGGWAGAGQLRRGPSHPCTERFLSSPDLCAQRG